MSKSHLALLLLFFGFIPSAVYSLLLVPWIGYIVLLRRGRLATNALLPLWPILLLIVQGVVFGDLANIGAVGKDGWYFLKMLLVIQAGLLIGYYTPGDRDWIRPIAWAVAILSIDQVFRALAGLGGEHARHISFVGIFLIPFIFQFYPGNVTVRLLLIAPVILTILLAQSRTGIIVLLISYIGSRGGYLSKKRALVWVAMVVMIAAIGYQFLPQYSLENITFLGKLQNGLTEIFFEDGNDKYSMYANWRGFEAYRSFATWQQGSVLQMIFGGGFGQYIDLGKYVALGDDYEVSSIPYAHNGYFSILVKLGLAGLFFFMYFILTPFFLNSKLRFAQEQIAARVSTAASVTLIFTTLVIAGPLNKESIDGISLIFGFSIGALYRLRMVERSSRALRLRTLAAGL